MVVTVRSWPDKAVSLTVTSPRRWWPGDRTATPVRLGWRGAAAVGVSVWRANTATMGRTVVSLIRAG